MMRFAHGAAALLLLSLGCQNADDAVQVQPPAKLEAALTQVSDLSATGELVPDGGDPGAAQPLERDSDGVTFRGFIEATPGTYTLEIVFRGVPVGQSSALFLGRWVSDSFTVLRGNAASASFSKPLDTIGRSSDGGDADGDGLGFLDELTWGTDPASSDSDGDGVDDGTDCFPDDSAKSDTIAAGGNIEDCDGDGAYRGDLPFAVSAARKPDCNDLDAAESPTNPPEQEPNDCGDQIDADCDNTTCASDSGGMISQIDPPDGSTLGCQRQIRAQIAGNIQFGFVSFVDLAGVASAHPLLNMALIPGETNLWISDPLVNVMGMVASQFTMTQTVSIEAWNAGSVLSSQSVTYHFDFEKPQITMTPQSITDSSSPVTVEVTASIPNTGVSRIDLSLIAQDAAGKYYATDAELLATTSSSPLQTQVDLSARSDGTYLIYPVVTDTIGNGAPLPAVIHVLGVDPANTAQQAHSLPYTCLGVTEYLYVPVLTAIVGGPAMRLRMQDVLNAAQTMAAARDAGAALVQVWGSALGNDGYVDLSSPTSYIPTWRFDYHNSTSGDTFSIDWISQAYINLGNTRPRLQSPGAGVTTAPLNVASLPGSDAVATAHANAGCPALSGADTDYIQYANDGVQDAVMVMANGSAFKAPTNDLSNPLPGLNCQ